MPEAKKNPTPAEKAAVGKEQITRLNLFFLDYFRLITLAAMLLFFAIGFFYLLKPKYDTIRLNIAESYENKQAEYEQLENYHRNLIQYANTYKNISQADKDRINAMVPDGDSYKELYYLMNDIVSRHYMILKGLEIKPEDAPVAVDKEVAGKTNKEANAARRGKIEVSMDIIGVNYDGLKKLLAAIENNLRLMDVNKIDFDPGARTVNLEVALYYLKPAGN
ncbi:MAG: hypothetical protein V1867_05965 [Candidatus Falkowbacteria bacterium]